MSTGAAESSAAIIAGNTFGGGTGLGALTLSNNGDLAARGIRGAGAGSQRQPGHSGRGFRGCRD